MSWSTSLVKLSTYEVETHQKRLGEIVARKVKAEVRLAALGVPLRFVGVSGPGLVNPEWVASMSKDAIVFAMANPIPEIMPEEMPDNVTVVDGFCLTTQVARLMASADALLHAGDQETFGLVILEAMACGIPVVAVAAGAFPEIVTASCGLLCTPNNSTAMANAVRELFSQDNAALGKTARCHVERQYSWDTVVNSLLGHYHAVLGSQWPLTANG